MTMLLTFAEVCEAVAEYAERHGLGAGMKGSIPCTVTLTASGTEVTATVTLKIKP